jgi:hypothetical protein
MLVRWASAAMRSERDTQPVDVAVVPVEQVCQVGGIALSGHEADDEGGQQLTQQVRACLGELVLEHAGSIDTGGDGHQGILSRMLWKFHSKDHPVAVAYSGTDTLTGSRTPLCRTQLTELLPR